MDEKYQVVPPLSDEEYELLKRDIGDNGVLIPVEYDEDGSILDGHHRVQACQELGLTEWPRTIRKNLTEDEKRGFARRVNLFRRQLKREQKQILIREQLKETPEKSDRQIANMLGVSDKTVGTQRKKMEATAEIPQLKKTTGVDGKTRPRQTQHKQNSTNGTNRQSTQNGKIQNAQQSVHKHNDNKSSKPREPEEQSITTQPAKGSPSVMSQEEAYEWKRKAKLASSEVWAAKDRIRTLTKEKSALKTKIKDLESHLDNPDAFSTINRLRGALNNFVTDIKSDPTSMTPQELVFIKNDILATTSLIEDMRTSTNQ
jgi:ParB-like chromosome segregation protein Spo0J